MLEVRRRSECEVEFSGEVVLTTAEAFRSALVEYVDTPGEVQLGFADVVDMDTAGLQVLLAFVRDRTAGPVTIRDMPEVLKRRVRLAGLATRIPV